LRDDIEPLTGLTLGKNLLSCTEELSHRTSGEELHFRFRQAGK
jgi:hypothetical protein